MLNSFGKLDLEGSACFEIHCLVSFALCSMEPLFKPWQYFPLCIHVFGTAEKRSPPDGNVVCKLLKCYFWKEHLQNNCLGLHNRPWQKSDTLAGKGWWKQKGSSPFLEDKYFKKIFKKASCGFNLKSFFYFFFLRGGAEHSKMNFNKWRYKQVLLYSATQVCPSGISEEMGRGKASGWLLSNLHEVLDTGAGKVVERGWTNQQRPQPADFIDRDSIP